jgi:hypothetical protein
MYIITTHPQPGWKRVGASKQRVGAQEVEMSESLSSGCIILLALLQISSMHVSTHHPVGHQTPCFPQPGPEEHESSGMLVSLEQAAKRCWRVQGTHILCQLYLRRKDTWAGGGGRKWNFGMTGSPPFFLLCQLGFEHRHQALAVGMAGRSEWCLLFPHGAKASSLACAPL